MTKEEFTAKRTTISGNEPESAGNLRKLAKIQLYIGIALCVIIIIIAVVTGVTAEAFGAFLSIAIAGVILLIPFLVTYIFLTGFADVVTNTRRAADYSDLQAEMLSDVLYGKNNTIYSDSTAARPEPSEEFTDNLPTI